VNRDAAVTLRTLGLIGGMSWESTAEYYRLLNRRVASRLGGLHSASLVLHSVDFAHVADLQARGDWTAAGALLAESARGLERAGADALLLCTNTMHHVAEAIESAVRIPFIHIVDVTGAALHVSGVQRAALLGTRYTMELPFWKERLASRHGIDVMVPPGPARAKVHRIIYDELCRGITADASRRAYIDIIEALAVRGAEAVILGCTEIGLLLGQADSPLPVFDTTSLHVDVGVDFALGVSQSAAAPQS
jgi:aspartate racemase